jgi:hypothetical protein
VEAGQVYLLMNGLRNNTSSTRRRKQMAMDFEELDTTTRSYMLIEFDAEQSGGNPYQSKLLGMAGLVAFPDLMRKAIIRGNEETLVASLVDPSFWKASDSRNRQINVLQVAERLGVTEFNTWYVRGVAKRFLDEGVMYCQAYRASFPRSESSSCSAHEGQIFSVKEIYAGHRARYWPAPGNPNAISIPSGPTCHHTIRRMR